MILWHMETSPYCCELDGHKYIFDVGGDEFGRIFRVKILNIHNLPSFLSNHIATFNEARAMMDGGSKGCSFKFGQNIIPESNVPSLVVPAGFIDKSNISLSIRLYLSGGCVVKTNHATLDAGVVGDDLEGGRGAVEDGVYPSTSGPPNSLASAEEGSSGGDHDYIGVTTGVYINPDQMAQSSSSSSSR